MGEPVFLPWSGKRAEKAKAQSGEYVLELIKK